MFCGALGWWAILCTASVALRQHFTGKGILWLNRIAGAVILAFGIVALISLLPLPWRHWARVLEAKGVSSVGILAALDARRASPRCAPRS